MNGHCTKAESVIILSDTIIATFPDGVVATISHEPDYFVGWLTPLTIPEYFKLGISPDLYTVIWPNGYEAQLYDAYDYVIKHNVNIVTYGYNWLARNILNNTELYELLSQPICDDYLEACTDIDYVQKQLEIIKNNIPKD